MAQHGTCQVERKREVGSEARGMLGREKRLNCALRVSERSAWKRWAREGLPRSIWKYAFSVWEKSPTEFFTESLILAQNERWRRV